MGSGASKLLTDVDETPLSRLLPRVLRWAQSRNNEELETWTRLELHGYWNTNPALTDEVVVPEYRTVPGFWTDDYGRPLVIDDDSITFVNETRLRQGAVELEGLQGAKGPLAVRLPGFADIIREGLGVEVTTFNFDPGVIPSVISAIKTELSDRLIASAQGPSTPESYQDDEDRMPILQLKPSFYGMGVDLRAAWKRLQAWRRREK